MTPTTTQPSYTIRRSVPTDFAATVAKAHEELQKEGFGILSEIDIQAKMKEKLGKDMPPYVILGACAPPLAWKALGAEPDLGVMLPCNVCVYVDAAGATVVSAMQPKAALEMIHNPVVDEVAGEASARLTRAVAAI